VAAKDTGTGLLDFCRAIFAKWFSAMSGPLSVQAAIAAAFVENQTVKVSLALTAFVCAWAAAYAVWKIERERVVALAGQLAPIKQREIHAQETHALELRRHTEELETQRTAAERDRLRSQFLAPPRPLNIEVGKEGSFISRKGYGASTINHTDNLKVTNRDRSKPITNCRVAIVDVTPDPLNKKLPWLLHEPFSLSSGDGILIPLATFGESRNPKENPS
jgi:hypothetical protein